MTCVGALPGVDELLLIDGGEDDVERLAEPAQQLVLPLDRQRRRAEDEHALDGLAELQLLDEQAGHDRLAGAGVVGEQEAQPRLRQHLLVDGLDLVRQRADARQADGELAVVGVGQPDAGRLDEEAQALGIDRANGRHGFRLVFQESADVLFGEHRLIELPCRQANTDFHARAKRAYRFDDDVALKVAGKR